LRESLAEHFGKENVFLDIDTIPPGVPWRKAIEGTISECDVLLPVIGMHWSSVRDEQGRRRLDQPNDFLRFEIASALQAGVRLIPVQLHGAPMPRPEDLPEEIAELADYQSIHIDDDDWPGDIHKLVGALNRIRDEKAGTAAGVTEVTSAASPHAVAPPSGSLRVPAGEAAATSERGFAGTEPRASQDRRHTRRPVLLGVAAALVVAALAGGIYALVARDGSGSDGRATATVDRLLSSVFAANSKLGRTLAGLDGNDSTLADARLAASQVAEEAARAQASSRILELPGERESSRALLEQALDANVEYAQKVAAAAAELTSARAADAEDAEGAARSAYDELAAEWPEVVDPSPPALSGAAELRALAEERTAAGERDEEELRNYVQAVDALLRNSAETRGDLADLIADVQSRRLTLGDARDGIETIINQRLGLRDDVAAIAAPEPYRRAKELLRRSITLSLENDIAVRRWINAYYAGLPSASERLSEVESGGRQATAAKERFVAEYNRVRRETLALPPLGVDTDY
jgi:hypothetical protein